MNKTEHYNLNQWQRHDRVLMDDFNADNAKIDAALKAEADARTAGDAAEAAARKTLEKQVNAKATQSALDAETAARNALAAELRPRAGAQLIRTGSITASEKEFDVVLTDIDWSAWKMVCVQLDIHGNTTTVSTRGKQTSAVKMGTITNMSADPDQRLRCNVIFFPFFDPRSSAAAVFLGGSGSGVYMGPCAYTDFYSITATLESSSGSLAGSSYRIWGEK